MANTGDYVILFKKGNNGILMLETWVVPASSGPNVHVAHRFKTEKAAERYAQATFDDNTYVQIVKLVI